MAKLTKAAARAELKRRQALQVKDAKLPFDPRAILYPDQLAVMDDPTPDRTWVGTRQCGKSTLALVLLIQAAIDHPGSESAYCDLDIDHASGVLIPDLLRFLDKYDVPARFVDGTLRFDNGSSVFIFSARAAEITKLQGLRAALVVVDEAQDAGDLLGLITMVRPALIKHGGRLLAMGVPGYMREVGAWWDITEGKAAGGWGQHRGHMDRNTHLTDAERDRLRAAAKAELGESSPQYVRHWLGLWPTTDNSLRVYRYFPDRHGYSGGRVPGQDPEAYLGLDPGGLSSAESVQVFTRSTDGHVWHVDEVESEPREGGGYDLTGERVGPLDAKWRPLRRVMDPGSAQKSGLLLRYQQDTLITMEAQTGKDRVAEVQRINRMFELGVLHILRGSRLERILLTACWDPRTLDGGKAPDYDAPTKRNGGPNAADAMRCAVSVIPLYVDPEKVQHRLTDVEREAAALERIKTSRPKPPTIQTAADVILGRPPVTKSYGPPKNPYGLG